MRELNAAAVSAAQAAWPQGRVYKVGEVPASPVTPYLVLSVTAGAPTSYTLDVTHGMKSHRLVAQAVGKFYDEVALAVERADAAFEDAVLTVSGLDLGPMAGDERVASPVIRDPDAGGLLTCTVIYPFAVSVAA